MTSFTRIDDGEQPSISLHPENTISDINPNIYGGFVEHMGRCIYGGLYDPESPQADENGFRKDVLEAIKDLKPPVVRYPGGNFTATYHWLDGVGPKNERPKRPELAWLGIETNEFGTDEFMKWCELVGCEPYLCFNMGTGTLDEALAWLEYCNSTQDTYYANLRRKNGRDKPYNVKYWALGNEVWGPWQVAQTTKEEYAQRAFQWAKALKLLDPSIQLVLCGQDGFGSWDYHVLKECIKWSGHGLGGSTTSSFIDMHSIHLYTASDEHVPNVFGPRAAERGIEIASRLIDLARIENKVPPTVPKQTICYDEWNTWDPKKAPGDKGGEQVYTLSDALAVGAWLNAFIRQSKHIGMANIAQNVNVLSPLLTSKDGLVKQSIYYPLYLFSKYMRGQALSVHVRSPEYIGPMDQCLSADGTNFGWIRGMCDTPWLDVSATLSDAIEDEKEGKYISLAVINVSDFKEYETKLDVSMGLRGKILDTYMVRGSHPKDVNTAEKEEVYIDYLRRPGSATYTFPKHSLTVMRWKVEGVSKGRNQDKISTFTV